MTSFGDKLRELRKQNNLTQRELAKRISTDFTYISKLENNRGSPPSEKTILKMCKVLNVPHQELLSLAGKLSTPVKTKLNACPGAIKFIEEALGLELTSSEWDILLAHLGQLRGSTETFSNSGVCNELLGVISRLTHENEQLQSDLEFSNWLCQRLESD